ncbi:aldose epimerase family protein [Pseudooceanicola aestuarii]|uniref:aldose epimerase family protein n=1 Tax=Pseudooceanicola aestuarii TaxID=2697319 RepID=UPI0013D4CD65|nr:aldose epimerase family protein [Pseudooceanicola aestuarii]
MSRTPFGTTPDGQTVEALTLAGGGLTARLLTWGAVVQDLRLDGVDHPLVLGAPDLAPYLGPMLYFGAITGRFANRIAGGRFTQDGVTYHTDRNDPGGTLHGGTHGTGQCLWQVLDHRPETATLGLTLPDGHMGFPGRIDIRATCALPGDGTLAFDLWARSDAPTPCSLTHHSYFTLGGADVLDHRLTLHADHYLPVTGSGIPDGLPAPVSGTRFDFRQSRPLRPGGFDHNFCLAGPRGTLRPVARLDGPSLSVEVATTECGLQVYDAGHIEALPGLDGRTYGPHAGVALEPQAWPDAPNRADFPDATLRPGEDYRHQLRYRFTRTQ